MLARTITAKQKLWLSHVKAADASDSSIADYAEAHGLRLKTLYQWKTKLVKLGFTDLALSRVSPHLFRLDRYNLLLVFQAARSNWWMGRRLSLPVNWMPR